MKRQLFTFIMAISILGGLFIGKSMDAHALDNNAGVQGAATAATDPDFDAAYYSHRYPDLRAAGLRTPEQLYQHWITYGKSEGRTGKP